MKIRTIVSSALSVVSAIVCSSAGAETISWYRFDEGEIDTKPAGATAVIVDSVTGVADGKAYAHLDNQFKTTEAAMPEYGAAFPAPAGCYDPVAKTFAANDKCLRFLSPNGDWNAASLVTLADRQAYRAESLTIEAFIRVERDFEDRWRFIVTKRGNKEDGSAVGAWMTGFNGASGRLFMYVTTKVTAEDGTVTYPGTEQTTFGDSVLDGKWHHVAMVIDGANKKLYKYLDYVKRAETAYSGELAYGDVAENNAIYVGKYWGNYGGFPGSIDEVRISSGVLTPKEFLRPTVVAKECLPETVLYLPFEELSFFGGSWRSYAMLLNQAIPSDTATINSIAFSKTTEDLVAVDEAVNAAFTRRNIAATTMTTNTAALKTVACPTATKEVCPRITFNDLVDDRHSAIAGSFTLELFAKLNQPSSLSGARYIANLRGLSVPLYLSTGGQLRFNPQWKGEIGTGFSVCDGRWHHIAIAYDRPAKTYSLYLDYAPVASTTIADELPVSTTSGGNNYLFGWSDDAEGGVSGWFDGIRLTTKALAPQDFLTTREIADTGYSVLLDFEESIAAVKPYADITPSGVNSAMASGVAATLGRAVVATRVRAHAGAPERKNRQSLCLAGSQVAYPRNVMIEELEDQTIEFFLCGKSAAENCGIIALTDDGGNPIWAFTANAAGGLVLNVGDAAYDLATDMTDGRWNHFALSFGKNENGTIAMNVYRNWTLLRSEELASLASYAMTSLVLGGGSGAFVGNIDEIRISPKVLSVDELMQPYFIGARLSIR
ncbi:MAG: LamG-like jellyroll fold domain-containing protein [Kiritimatiellia bacterium]